MAETIEARWLREHWNEDFLSRFDNQWIAVRDNEIVASGESLEQVMNHAEPEPAMRSKPLYAFVYLGRLQ